MKGINSGFKSVSAITAGSQQDVSADFAQDLDEDYSTFTAEIDILKVPMKLSDDKIANYNNLVKKTYDEIKKGLN